MGILGVVHFYGFHLCCLVWFGIFLNVEDKKIIHTSGKKLHFALVAQYCVLTKKTCEHACWFKLVRKQHLSPQVIL